jgi:O-antigen ligase
VLVSSRRALMLLILLAPIMIFFFRSFQPEAERRRNRRSFITLLVVLSIIAILLFIGFASIYQFDPSSLWERFASGFNLGAQTADNSAIERHQQVIALWHGWLERPFLGAGHGFGVLGSIRSETMPWAYELTYLALLFQTGIVGFAAYSAGVLWIICRSIDIIRDGGSLGRIMLPMLVGFCGLLIANATNPYLLKFDGMWMLFLPLAVVNCGLLTQSRGPRPV